MAGPLSRWTPEQLIAIAADDPGGELYSATAVLANMTESVSRQSRRITETDVLADLGIVEGDSLLSAIESAVSPRVGRLLKSDKGIDICDPQSVALVHSLQANTVITQSQADALLGLRMEERPKWPGIRAADLELARTL